MATDFLPVLYIPAGLVVALVVVVAVFILFEIFDR
jgi:hypothetical protein